MLFGAPAGELSRGLRRHLHLPPHGGRAGGRAGSEGRARAQRGLAASASVPRRPPCCAGQVCRPTGRLDLRCGDADKRDVIPGKRAASEQQLSSLATRGQKASLFPFTLKERVAITATGDASIPLRRCVLRAPSESVRLCPSALAAANGAASVLGPSRKPVAEARVVTHSAPGFFQGFHSQTAKPAVDSPGRTQSISVCASSCLRFKALGQLSVDSCSSESSGCLVAARGAGPRGLRGPCSPWGANSLLFTAEESRLEHVTCRNEHLAAF